LRLRSGGNPRVAHLHVLLETLTTFVRVKTNPMLADPTWLEAR
jgi:hypothetical protein